MVSFPNSYSLLLLYYMYVLFLGLLLLLLLSTAVEQVVACALVTQRARVRSPVGTSFLGEGFRGFSLPVRQMSGSFRPQSPRISFGHHHHPYSFITGANDLRCWSALKNLKYTFKAEPLSVTTRFGRCWASSCSFHMSIKRTCAAHQAIYITNRV